MTRKLPRGRAREVLDVGPDETADDAWRWLLGRMAEDNLSLHARVEELEGITGTSLGGASATWCTHGDERQKELVSRMREAGSPITEYTLSEYVWRKHAAPRHFF